MDRRHQNRWGAGNASVWIISDNSSNERTQSLHQHPRCARVGCYLDRLFRKSLALRWTRIRVGGEPLARHLVWTPKRPLGMPNDRRLLSVAVARGARERPLSHR